MDICGAHILSMISDEHLPFAGRPAFRAKARYLLLRRLAGGSHQKLCGKIETQHS